MSPIPILMYHNLGTPPAGTRYRSLYVREGAFARQMSLLRLLGYRGIGMEEAMPYLRGEAQGKVAVITFDDGYVDTLEAALPILQRYGFRATCYAVSGLLGGWNDWDENAGVRKRLMDLAQLREWRRAGMEVGAHSRSHPQLTQCDDRRLHEEIMGSKGDLEDLLGEPITQFCYPFGNVDERVVMATRDAGFTAATTTLRGRARPGDDLMRLKRVLVAGHNLLHLFAMKLTTGYEDRRG